jgi:SAM-dependent methyltransferase
MTSPAPGLLGDTAARDYARKLHLFSAFAEPELRQAVSALDIEPGSRVLDAGCGTGETLRWLTAAAGAHGQVVGLDLASAHLAAARATLGPAAQIVQADLLKPPLVPGSFDLIWTVNTINHVRDPDAGLARLRALLAPAGRLALGQSSLLPEMYFAWDARLERLTHEAVRSYYRARYGLAEQDLSGVRALVGWLRRAALREVSVHTYLIERVAPLRPADEAYLLEAIFRGTWGERLRPYLDGDDYQALAQLCDPQDSRYALRRPDFHFLQSFTLAIGRL